MVRVRISVITTLELGILLELGLDVLTTLG